MPQGGLLQELPQGELPPDAHQALPPRVLEIPGLDAERRRPGLRQDHRRVRRRHHPQEERQRPGQDGHLREEEESVAVARIRGGHGHGRAQDGHVGADAGVEHRELLLQPGHRRHVTGDCVSRQVEGGEDAHWDKDAFSSEKCGARVRGQVEEAIR